MKSFRYCIVLFFLITHVTGLFAQSIVIDHHAVSLFPYIPPAYAQSASELRMLFMDRSVGFNISTYLDCLSTPWGSAPSSCKRYQHMDPLYDVDPSEVYWDGTWDRTLWQYRFWPDGCSEDVTCFIDYMHDRLDSFDVYGCQFSYLAVAPGSTIADTLSGFFGVQGSANKASAYAAFANLHPDKKLIWWTTSLARAIGTTESTAFNDQVRAYADAHDIILFDVADILSHDPVDQPCFDNRDGVMYKDENYPDDSLDLPAICPQYTTETEGGHLGAISAGGIRVAKAFWVLMARIAGWDGHPEKVVESMENGFLIFPNPVSQTQYSIAIEPPSEREEGLIHVYSLSGRLVFSKKTIPHHESLIHLPITGLGPGLYIVEWRTNRQISRQKLVVN